MAGGGVNYSLSAISPTIFEPAVNEPLRKMLVSLDVAEVNPLPQGKTVSIRRFSGMTAAAYVPGTPITAAAATWAADSIVITTYKHSTFYHDMVVEPLIDINDVRELAFDTAYQLRNKIDTHVFQNITGADGFTGVGADAQLLGGSAHRPVSAGSANIINLFAAARNLLRNNNVEEMGDWCAVVTPKIASFIEIKAANTGFSLADSVLRNGYAGSWMGFDVYWSNNLPSGSCSTIAPNVSVAAVSATTCKSIFFGRKKMIKLYMQPPRLYVGQLGDKVGANYITYATYGSGIPTNNRSRGLNVAVQSGYY